jgi:hypothetical protein
MSRRARRRLGGTGAVSKQVENVRADACHAASQLWDVCCDRQSVVWLDNWYRRRFGTNPDGDDQSLNVSALAILHVPELDPFPGHPSLKELVSGVPAAAAALLRAIVRVQSGVASVNAEPLQPAWVRVPLDVHRTGMRSVPWMPYQLTEFTVSSQGDLLQIVDDLHTLQRHTRHCVPLLVDMDIHYRLQKLMYGRSLATHDYRRTLARVPVLYGVYPVTPSASILHCIYVTVHKCHAWLAQCERL